MPNSEFNLQTLRTPDQWNAGVHSLLRIGKDGLELFSAPAFDRFLPTQNPADIAISMQGEIFTTAQKAKKDWLLIRFGPSTCRDEAMLSLSSYGVTEPTRLWWTTRHLWVLDHANRRLLGFALGTFQLTREIQVPGTLVDADIQTGPDLETVYILVGLPDEFKVYEYPAPPGRQSSFTSPLWKKPAALAVTGGGTIYILDTVLERFIRFKKHPSVLGEQSQEELKNFKPVAMEIDPAGAIYVASDKGELKLFDLDGSFLMKVKLPSAKLPPAVTSIQGMGFDGRGGFYLASNRGIEVFALSKAPVGVQGRLYPPVLDNGKTEGTWHGAAIEAVLPARSGMEIAYYASDSEGLKAAYDQVLESTGAAEDKALRIESLLSPLWRFDTGEFTGSGSGEAARNMLFVANQGRYLWLRIQLTAYDAESRPRVSEIKVSYPRLSLLRYLPPVYQEDQVSTAFLERFLALFETVFQEVDLQITDLYRKFDPETTPPEFLSWLASWVSLTLNDALPEDRKRQLIAQSPFLFQTKGTPAGIRRFLSAYTGAAAEVREPSLMADPFVAGNIRLGQGSVLARNAGGAVKVGDNTILGETLLTPKSAVPTGPLAAAANRFEIVLDMEPAQFAAREPAIRRAIRGFVPASTEFTLSLAPTQSGIGSARLGFNARVAQPQPFRVGVTQLGAGQILSQDFPAPRLGRGAAVTPDWRLVE
jgi:phage tail-like protein